MFDRLVLVVSGKMGAGKDTVAPAVMAKLGRPSARQLSFSSALKDETDSLFSAFREGCSDDSLVTMMGGEVSQRQVADLRRIWFGIPPCVGARGRHPAVRAALQFWGTEVRRGQDVNYWVHRTGRDVTEVVGEGFAVFLTDARFPNEVTGFQQMGAVAVRLEVPEHIRMARLEVRDGFVPDEAGQNHPSEVALDRWRGFDVVVNNVGAVREVAAEAAEGVRCAAARRGLNLSAC